MPKSCSRVSHLPTKDSNVIYLTFIADSYTLSLCSKNPQGYDFASSIDKKFPYCFISKLLLIEVCSCSTSYTVSKIEYSKLLITLRTNLEINTEWQNGLLAENKEGKQRDNFFEQYV